MKWYAKDATQPGGIMSNARHRVVVIGGSFAGVNAA